MPEQEQMRESPPQPAAPWQLLLLLPVAMMPVAVTQEKVPPWLTFSGLLGPSEAMMMRRQR